MKGFLDLGINVPPCFIGLIIEECTVWMGVEGHLLDHLQRKPSKLIFYVNYCEGIILDYGLVNLSYIVRQLGIIYFKSDIPCSPINCSHIKEEDRHILERAYISLPSK